MENIIRIPTAKQAREMIAQKADEKCSNVWSDILHSVESLLTSAINECKTMVCIPESALRGVPSNVVYLKLRPYLEGMGYYVYENFQEDICISWNKMEDDDESV